MAAPKYLHLDNQRGGRSGLNPFDLLPGQVAEALNVDGFDGLWGGKRGGADSLSLTGGTAFTGPMNALARWVPGTDDTAAEMWGIDSAATPLVKRLAAGTAWADVTLADAITSRAQDACFAALNGKVFITYKSAAQRLHVYDPTNFSPTILSELTGGGGGGGGTGGGGGGGAVRTFADTGVLGALAVALGNGGTAGTPLHDGAVGGDTTFNAHTAGGGGFGAGNAGSVNGGNGANGSSGGGAPSTNVAGVGGTGNSPGHNGGANNSGGAQFGGGGGGGSTSAGGNGSTTNGGAGGAGTASTVPGSANVLGGGGGGGIQGAAVGGVGGTGGGGNGTGTSAAAGGAGTDGLGGGGGGSGNNGGNGLSGGVGGKGRCTIWYLTGTMTATGGTITTSGLYTIHDFTTSGTFTVTAILPPLRRVGIAPGASAPTAVNAGAGAYAATPRMYRLRWLHMNGAAIIRRSEYTPAVSFTPSGAGASVTVTRPAAPGEGETHWEVEVSIDSGVTYFVLAGVLGVTLSTQIAIATTTYSDSTVTTSYSNGGLSDPTGYYTLPHSAKFLVTDSNRLIWAGDNDGVQPGSRVWYSPVLNSALKGDDERWLNTDFRKNYMDLGTKDGGDITALGYPLNGVIFVFKYKAIWALYPTGDVNGPYIFRKLRDDIGCVDQKSVQLCRDVTGRNALHFWDALTGPWRVSSQGGFEYLGRDMEDVTSTVNLGATNRVMHSLWHSGKHQWWVYLAVGSDNDPSVKYAFDPLRVQRDEQGLLRGGWYKHTGDSCVARCSCMFANTVAASMSAYLKPYVGLTTGTAKVYKADSDGTNDDAGTAFQAYIDSAPVYPPLEGGIMTSIGEAILTAKSASGVTIQMSTEADFGGTARTKTSTALLTPESTETRVFRKFDDSNLSDLKVFQVRIGDSAAVSNRWVVDRVSIPISAEGTA